MRGGLAAQSFEAGEPGVPVVPGFRRPRKPAVESWTVTADDVDAWLKNAQVGDVLVYARGPTLIQGAAAARIRTLMKTDEVMALPQRRTEDGGFDYRVARNRVRVVTARRCAQVVKDPMTMAVLLVLQAAAEAGERCPTNAQLAAETELTRDQVGRFIKNLIAAGVIATRTVPAPGDPKFRVVRIVATGAETAGPDVRGTSAAGSLRGPQ